MGVLKETDLPSPPAVSHPPTRAKGLPAHQGWSWPGTEPVPSSSQPGGARTDLLHVQGHQGFLSCQEDADLHCY